MVLGFWSLAFDRYHSAFLTKTEDQRPKTEFLMYPELFRIGSFPINTYGVFLAIAFLCAILISVKLAARDGLPREKIYDLSLWMLVASLDRLKSADALYGTRIP